MRIYSAVGRERVVGTSEIQQSQIRPEAALESLLHANPRLICDEPLLILDRQARVDSGIVDLLAVDEFGNLLVVEVKIGRSGTGSASEETILSQPQTYAASLSTFNYDELDELYSQYKSKLETEGWNVTQVDALGGTLQSDFEATFGRELNEEDFNTEQRLVVVAEDITQRTAANVRYLLEQGLHFQCTEVRQYDSPETNSDGRHLLASKVIVDYDLNRVRPKRRQSPTFPELAGEILERAFPDFQSVVGAESITELFPEGLDTREHRLESHNPAHPDGVVYRLGVKPDQGTIRIGIDILSGDDKAGHLQRLQSNREVFEERGFEVTGNETYRVVIREWTFKDAAAVDSQVEEIAAEYAALVQLSHNIFASPGST